MFSIQFYNYNSRELRFDKPLKVGDVIKAIEFNTDTQLYDVKLSDKPYKISSEIF